MPVVMTDPAPAPQQLDLFDDPPAASAPAVSTSAPPLLAEPLRLPAPPNARHETWLAGHRVGYALRRARRRSIGLVVGPEGLVVSAPRWVPMAEVETVLQAKSRWILLKLQSQQDRTRRQLDARVEWRDGAVLPFLGESVILVIDPRAHGAVLQIGRAHV